MFPARLTRGALLALGAAGAASSLAHKARAAVSPGLITDVEVTNGARPFAGDHPLLTTLFPAGPSGRRAVTGRFRLRRPANVQFDVLDRNAPGSLALATEGGVAGSSPKILVSEHHTFGRGLHKLVWEPDPSIPPATYSLVLSVTDFDGRRTTLGAATPAHRSLPAAPIARVMGLDAAFTRRSYAPAGQATLVLATDARAVTLQLIQSGPEATETYADNAVEGVPVGDELTLDWGANADRPTPVQIPIGDWPSGMYFARLQSDDGRLGFAPFVLRPVAPSRRVLVCLPTNTWQAYNFYDADGDGFGDSWYVSWAIPSIDLTRPHLHRGVPFRYRSYDLGFLHWLERTGKEADFYADDDLAAFGTGDALRSAYDLVVFPGHEEYVTGSVFDIVERYRDLGGNLAFLSANNFFRRVDPSGTRLTLAGLWRDLGRPEAALVGVQYRASDRGTHQAPYVLTDAGAASWALAGTGLAPGATFGRYGIEIDATAASSPPGTQVLAELPNLLGPGLTGEMAYYESPSGARVFAAGALNVGGQCLLWPETVQLLENVWSTLAPPGA